MRSISALFTAAVTLALSTNARTDNIPFGPRNNKDSIALATAIYLVALTNGTRTAHGTDAPQLVCVSGPNNDKDPSREILDSLQSNRSVLVLPISACRKDPSRRLPGESIMLDTLTGKRGISIYAGLPVFSTDSHFYVVTSYYQHGLSSAAWGCTGKRNDGRWTITSCRMGRVS